MTQLSALDLFSGAGGVARGLQRAGFHVTGVDIAPQPHYVGDVFIQADAMTFDLAGYDFIWASPPCQGYTGMKTRWVDREHPMLIEPMRERLLAQSTPWIIENVEGAAKHLRSPIMVCGTMFDPPMDIRRHRYFESLISLVPPQWPCRHSLLGPRFDVYEHGKWRKAPTVPVYGNGGAKANAAGPGAMGIDWMTRAELVEAIPPAYSFFLGVQCRQYIERTAEDATRTRSHILRSA